MRKLLFFVLGILALPAITAAQQLCNDCLFLCNVLNEPQLSECVATCDPFCGAPTPPVTPEPDPDPVVDLCADCLFLCMGGITCIATCDGLCGTATVVPPISTGGTLPVAPTLDPVVDLCADCLFLCMGDPVCIPTCDSFCSAPTPPTVSPTPVTPVTPTTNTPNAAVPAVVTYSISDGASSTQYAANPYMYSEVALPQGPRNGYRPADQGWGAWSTLITARPDTWRRGHYRPHFNPANGRQQSMVPYLCDGSATQPSACLPACDA